MKIHICPLCWLLLILLPAMIQAQRPVTITGTLLSAKDNSPVLYAHVYIPNTTYGTYSDEQGNFTLEARVWESFELVISQLEFEVTALNFSSDQSRIQLATIRLQPRAYDLKEVVVTQDENWARHYAIFIKNFIGTTPGATQCKINNKLSLNFKYDKETDQLIAWAYEPLLIENRHLGYRIRYDLVKFELEIGRSALIYTGFPAFEAITSKNKRQLRRWEKNRREAYQGSVMHFVRSLYHNTLSTEGFEPSEIAHQFRAQGEAVAVSATDAPVQRADIIRLDENEAAALCLQFNKRMKVRYYGAAEAFAYWQQNQSTVSSSEAPAKFQTSHLRLRDNNVVRIYSDGQVQDGVNLVLDGYFAWARIAQMLPYDYDR